MYDKEKTWYSISIEAETQTEEAIEFALNELDALGTEINNFGEKVSETSTIIGYFNEPIDDAIVRSRINEALRIYGFSNDAVKNFAWREIENQDWLAEWKKHWKPTETAKFIIAPTWEIVENTDKIVIRIEPSMAFGTGTHETTKLCLKAIEELYAGEMSFLDVGTGTGILAVGAAKIQDQSEKSKGKIVGCDTDFDSIVIARENALTNDTNGIEFFVGSISDETTEFDFVCANLTADVIVPLLPLLIKKSNKILVLSGILAEQADSIAGELERLQISDFKIEPDGEWIAFQIKRFAG